MKAFAIILAAGRGERFGSDKVMQDLGGRPVWQWSFDTFISHPLISGVGIVTSSSNISDIGTIATDAAFVVQGGSDRSRSVRCGMDFVPLDAEALVTHDGARPFVSGKLITRLVNAIESDGAAAAAVPSTDTLREVSENGTRLLDRSRVFNMQSPQGGLLRHMVEGYRPVDVHFTDDMGFLEAAGYPVTIVPGDPSNFKITTPDDLARARARIESVETRTGLGYDVHRFSSDATRALWLGGVRFEDGPGLEGHSDADVLIHAAVDALLGAAALGDIGQHFPPSDARWKDEGSATFLKHAACLLVENGWQVVNLDIAVVAERPRIMSRSAEMRGEMAKCLGVELDRVSVKATTNEGLGSIGRGEGIAAFATATIRRKV